MVIDPAYIVAIGGGLVSVGMSWGVAKGSAAGEQEARKNLQDAFNRHTEADDEHQLEVVDRLARIETKLDGLLNK
jgi:hypothetical protein